jgi:hypothetical protein
MAEEREDAPAARLGSGMDTAPSFNYFHIGSLDAIRRLYKCLPDRGNHQVELEYYYRLYSIEYHSGSGVTAGADRMGKYARRAGRRGRCSYVTVCI